MSLLVSSQPNKPNRLDPQRYPGKDTNREYHLDYAKWAIQSSQTAEHSKWLAKIKINKEFYKGDQWTFSEDIESFLQDNTGQTKNRIQIVHNIIRPMVEQYRGNASILKINATAKSISKFAVNRRELALSEKIFRTRLANEFPGLGEIMRKNDDSLGRNEAETTQIFENLYVDMYVTQINSLLKYVRHLNEFDRMQIKAAQNLALTGLIVGEPYEYSGHLRYRVIESEDFGFDTDARKLDLSDATYQWYVNPMDVSDIIEKYQPKGEDAKAIENYASTGNDTYTYADTANTREFKTSRIPVYKAFWRDTMKKEYGWVLDEYGYPFMTRINYTEPGEDGPKYTDADLIDPPNTPMNRRLFKNGAKKRRLFLNYVRQCTFIPGEVVGKAQDQNQEDDAYAEYDIVLDYGILDYHESDFYDLSSVKMPLKCQTWGYVDGEIFSPVDDAINPQRFINRVMSVTEQLINNSGGSGMIIDEDAIDPNSADEIYSDTQEGKPITVRTKGKGVPNTVGYYDNTPKQGTYNMFQVIPIIKGLVQDTTGVNEALKGESTGSDQLVGVTQLLIQRGSLMQEPFYNAISDWYVQLYQYAATVGKQMYIDNQRELAIITGDEGVEILQLAEDMRNEDFRAFITRENDEAMLRGQANQMLDIFLQTGMISDKSYANLYGRSTPDDVTLALRSEAGMRMEAKRRQAEEQAQYAQQLESEQRFKEERGRNDTIEARNQQERISDKQIASKERINFDKIVADDIKDERNRQ
jgi:hypothetical protein